MLPEYQPNVADFYNVPNSNIKRLISLWELATLRKTKIKTKKDTSRPRIQSITMATTTCWIQHTKKNWSRKNGDKDRKVFYKLMTNVVYGKAMENLRNKIDVKLPCNKKDYLE